MAILTLLVPTEDNVRVSFLVHQVPRTSATVLRYCRMFTQFSLHVWASEYTCRPMIVNLLHVLKPFIQLHLVWARAYFTTSKREGMYVTHIPHSENGKIQV